MLRLAAVLVAASLVGCAQVSPSDSGSGGSGGESGTGGAAGMDGAEGEGGLGGEGGAGGSAGSGGGGVGGVTPDPCALVSLEKSSDTEASDSVSELGIATGSVSGACVGGSCTGDDPFDRWTFTPCAGKHSIVLAWDDSARDLDLYLFDKDNIQIAQSATPSTMEETISAPLAAEAYFIEVQAFDTLGSSQQYRLEIRPSE